MMTEFHQESARPLIAAIKEAMARSGQKVVMQVEVPKIPDPKRARQLGLKTPEDLLKYLTPKEELISKVPPDLFWFGNFSLTDPTLPEILRRLTTVQESYQCGYQFGRVFMEGPDGVRIENPDRVAILAELSSPVKR